MNIRKYQNAKGNWCYYVTNTPTDRFRITTPYKDEDIAEHRRKEIESHLPLNKDGVERLIIEGGNHCFSSLMDNFIFKTTIEAGWSNSTSKFFECLKSKIMGHYGDVSIESMDEDWILSYIQWRSGDALNSTIEREVKAIRQFIRWVERKYKVRTGLLDTKVKFKKANPNVVFLNRDELKKMMDAGISKTYLERTRDLFIFGCMTGMRYSDIQKFNMSNVSDGRIVFTTQKTNDTLTIPINRTVEALIDKYGGILPKMEIQVYNGFLKELCREVGIDAPVKTIHYRGNERIEEVEPKWKLISSHSARKTFVSNALMFNIPTSVVMSMTGHHSFQSLQSYVAVADKAKTNAITVMEGMFS